MRRALGLVARVVRGRGWLSYSLVITLVLSPELSVGDLGKAAGENVLLTPSLAIGVLCSMHGVATTG